MVVVDGGFIALMPGRAVNSLTFIVDSDGKILQMDETRQDKTYLTISRRDRDEIETRSR